MPQSCNWLEKVSMQDGRQWYLDQPWHYLDCFHNQVNFYYSFGALSINYKFLISFPGNFTVNIIFRQKNCAKKIFNLVVGVSSLHWDCPRRMTCRLLVPAESLTACIKYLSCLRLDNQGSVFKPLYRYIFSHYFRYSLTQSYFFIAKNRVLWTKPRNFWWKDTFLYENMFSDVPQTIHHVSN